jgi:hypothetical protein
VPWELWWVVWKAEKSVEMKDVMWVDDLVLKWADSMVVYWDEMMVETMVVYLAGSKVVLKADWSVLQKVAAMAC